MHQIDVCLTPELLHLYDLKGKIVVIVDILRATTSMTSALANGVADITPVATVEACRDLQSQGYIAAAERDGKQVAGFELGNSPLAYLDGAFAGKRLAMSTTNGTLAIEKSKAEAAEVIIGSFLNLLAVCDYIQTQQKDVLVLCAGWKGKFNMEDTLFAGAVVESLVATHTYSCDAPLAAQRLYQVAKEDLIGFMSVASHTKRLQNHGIEKDIAFCFQLNEYTIVPKLRGSVLTK
nr:2-phosphosulfolactate phosphatase [Penaeicola halotolerans]